MTVRDGRRFAVIGGGLSGMTTALLLARHGRDVTLIEKKKAPGPTLRGFSRQGVHFDTGLHYAGGLSPDGPLRRYFRLLGLEGLPLADFNRDCFDRIRFPDAGVEIRLPIGYEATLDALCAAFPSEIRFIRDYLQKLREAFLSSAFLNFGAGPREPAGEPLYAESLEATLHKGTGNAFLRAALSVHSLLYGASPEETPFLQHARIAGSYLDGVKTVEGGGKALIAALEKQLAAAGVETVCGVAASQFRFSGQKHVTGVVLEDERLLPADGAVFTAHPALLPAMLPPGVVKPAFLNRLRSLEDTIATFTLFCAAETPVSVLQGSNLFVCSADGVAPGFRRDCIPEHGPFYISGNAAPSAPGGPIHGFIVFAPGSAGMFDAWKESVTGRRPETYTAFKKEKLASIRDAVIRRCPELAAADLLDGGTPLTNRDILESPGCGLYGTKHSLRQFSPLPVTRIPNLWMAGQSVIAPGVLGAIVSGVVACGFILGMEAMHGEVAACA
jgi:all-trans-retinol 13,14-reductase